MTKKYLYRGSMSTENINKIDYVFINGKEYDLPETNPRVLQMERQGRLTLIIDKKTKGTK